MLNRAGTFMMLPAGSGCPQSSVVIWWIPGLEFDHSPLTFLSLSAPVNIWTLQIVMLRPTHWHWDSRDSIPSLSVYLEKHKHFPSFSPDNWLLGTTVCNIWEVELNISLIQVDPRTTVRANLERTKLSDWTDDQLTVGGALPQQVELETSHSQTGCCPLGGVRTT